ncbi:Uncharacterised protein [Mycobacteroides abscessus subsp. bolletii]|nr:Uncharacterised protein [Mycobacteroides abscessus subsp. bolletii]
MCQHSGRRWSTADGYLKPGFLDRLQPRRGARTRTALLGDFQRTVGTLVALGGAFHSFDALEIGGDVRERPLLARHLSPVVIVRREATDPHHRVHRRRPAERLASWPVDLTVVQLRLGLGQVVPVDIAAEKLRERGGNVDSHVLILGAGLQDQHLIVGPFGEPGGQRCSRRSRAHNDKVSGKVLNHEWDGSGLDSMSRSFWYGTSPDMAAAAVSPQSPAFTGTPGSSSSRRYPARTPCRSG